ITDDRWSPLRRLGCSFVCRREVGCEPSYITDDRWSPLRCWGALLSVAERLVMNRHVSRDIEALSPTAVGVFFCLSPRGWM
ncbi:MAG: hypothetical protein IJY08_06630, partial [Clostridia bacterium]|nr:hypothetical protein [Clostridia bacterium]